MTLLEFDSQMYDPCIPRLRDLGHLLMCGTLIQPDHNDAEMFCGSNGMAKGSVLVAML